VVESDERHLVPLRLHFEGAGYEVAALATEQQVVELGSAQDPELIIATWTIPPRSRFSILAFLQAHKRAVLVVFTHIGGNDAADTVVPIGVHLRAPPLPNLLQLCDRVFLHSFLTRHPAAPTNLLPANSVWICWRKRPVAVVARFTSAQCLFVFLSF